MRNIVTRFNNRIPIDKIDSVDAVCPCPYGWCFLVYTKEFPMFCDIIIKHDREDAIAVRDEIIEAMVEED